MTPSPLRGQRDLERHHPALARAVGACCDRLPWCITGVSALLCDDVGLWFELTKPKHWLTRPDGATVIGLGAIGGALEPAETLLGCLARESREEIGQVPVVAPSSETTIVYEERVVRCVSASKQPAPVLLTVSANLHSRQRLPDCPTLAIVTYWGRLCCAPALGDLYGLVRLPFARVAEVLRYPEVTPAFLSGAETVLWQRAPLPERAIIRPVWAVRSLQLALQQGTITL